MRQAHVDAAVQEGSRSQQNVRGLKFQPQRGTHAAGVIALRQHLPHLILPDAQAGQGKERLLDGSHVGIAIHLGAGGPHGRALAHVESAELYAAGIGPQAHHAAQGVDFANHVPLGQAADGRIAGKMAQTIHIAGDKQRLVAHAGQGGRGFAAGMAAAHHDGVKGACGISGAVRHEQIPVRPGWWT